MLNKIGYILVFIFVFTTGCGDSASDGRPFTKDPGYEYMPDMYRSPSLETYGVNNFFSDSLNARYPVSGTIARGKLSTFPYDKTLEGYLSAKDAVNPVEGTAANIEEGKKLYSMFCKHCHGQNGAGGGTINHPVYSCLLYTSPSPRDVEESRMPSSA